MTLSELRVHITNEIGDGIKYLNKTSAKNILDNVTGKLKTK